MSVQKTIKVASILLLLAMSIGCEETGNSKYDPPADHTVNKDGFLHKSGLNQPMTSCTSCHGADLKGGTSDVSCFECHGKEW